jgi:hypothetical protein
LSTRTRWLIRVMAGLVVLSHAMAAPSRADAQDFVRFLAGAAVGLGTHESGHLLFDVAFDASPGVKKVSFGPLPFFAITHEPLSPAREYVVSASGFWMQHLTSELLLSRRPNLRRERAPMLKGLLAFNVLASVAYAGAAFGRVGPGERDTRGMAISAGVDEPLIGVLVLAPAALDAARYYEPEARWLAWASRAAKISSVLLVLKARS